jgi:hypothetical protein
MQRWQRPRPIAPCLSTRRYRRGLPLAAIRRRRRYPIRQLDAPLSVAIRPHAYPRRNRCD